MMKPYLLAFFASFGIATAAQAATVTILLEGEISELERDSGYTLSDDLVGDIFKYEATYENVAETSLVGATSYFASSIAITIGSVVNTTDTGSVSQLTIRNDVGGTSSAQLVSLYLPSTSSNPFPASFVNTTDYWNRTFINMRFFTNSSTALSNVNGLNSLIDPSFFDVNRLNLAYSGNFGGTNNIEYNIDLTNTSVIISDLSMTPVPLPASLPLLAVALGGIGFAARRKKSA